MTRTERRAVRFVLALLWLVTAGCIPLLPC